MDKAGYDGVRPHKRAHKDFLSKIKGLSAPLSDATIDYAKEWSVFSIIIKISADSIAVFIKYSLKFTKKLLEPHDMEPLCPYR